MPTLEKLLFKLALFAVAAVCSACAPKFNHTATTTSDVTASLNIFQLTPNQISPLTAGMKSTSATSSQFALSHVQFGQPVSVSISTSAQFSLNTRGPLSP